MVSTTVQKQPVKTYLIPPTGKAILLDLAPSTREEAIALVFARSPQPPATGPFRIVTVEEFEVSSVESCEVEVFAIGLRHYGSGRWGLIEASVSATYASADFSPTSADLALWLEALKDSWGRERIFISCALEQVEDFHVLQLYAGPRLLTSTTWNVPDVDARFRMPNTLDTPLHLWGDALLADIGLLYEALRGVNFFSLRK